MDGLECAQRLCKHETMPKFNRWRTSIGIASTYARNVFSATNTIIFTELRSPSRFLIIVRRFLIFRKRHRPVIHALSTL